MEIFIKIVQFFMSLSLLVAIHEFGHFIMARIFKIRVEKFYIFFDPWFSLFKWKRGDTEYGIGWLPLGGYVKIAGMIDESMDKEQMQAPPKPDEFRSKPAWQRFLVMIAGVTMNVILAFLIYTGICYTHGQSYMAAEDARWGYAFNDAAKDMGFRDGDKVVEIDGQPIEDVNDIRAMLLLTEGDRHVTIERDDRSEQFTIPFDKLLEMRRQKSYMDLYMLRLPFIVDSVASPSAAAAGLQAGDEVVACNGTANVDVPAITDILNGKVGVLLGNPYQLRTRHYTFLQSFPAGARLAGETIADYWQQLKLIFQPKTKMYEELGGFIAIGNIFPAEWDWLRFWNMTAFLSIMLAVLNILPIPALDGGHALFTLWEMLTGRKPSDKFLEVMQYIGFFLLLALVIYANGNDIYRLFGK